MLLQQLKLGILSFTKYHLEGGRVKNAQKNCHASSAQHPLLGLCFCFVIQREQDS